MATEIEATFTGVNHSELRHKLKAAGATCEYPMVLMRRKIFDYPDLRLDKRAAWVRLRDEGGKATLTYKQRLDETIGGMREIETEVLDFDATAEIMEAIGLTDKAYQESKRELWVLGNCEVTLDEWPWIPPIAEIEGPNEASVRQTANRLGLDWPDALFDSADSIYIQHFDVTRTQISSTSLTFGPIPHWLEKLRRSQSVNY